MQVVKFLYKGKLLYCGYVFSCSFFFFWFSSLLHDSIWGQEEALKFPQAGKNDMGSAMDL